MDSACCIHMNGRCCLNQLLLLLLMLLATVTGPLQRCSCSSCTPLLRRSPPSPFPLPYRLDCQHGDARCHHRG